MTTFVDTSVILDLVAEGDQPFAEWSSQQIGVAKGNGPVVVSDIVYSELSYGMASAADVNETINALALGRCGYTEDALFLAAKAFRKYKETTEGNKTNVLPDFLIGALASVAGHPLLTRDPSRIRNYFPDVQVIAPN